MEIFIKMLKRSSSLIFIKHLPFGKCFVVWRNADEAAIPADKFDSERQVSEVQLDAILEARRLATTAKNLQEQYIYVAQSAESLAKIDEATIRRSRRRPKLQPHLPQTSHRHRHPALKPER